MDTFGTAGAKRPLPDQESSRPRKRNATACHVCRARKTKCDNKKPRCSYCQSIGAACDESSEEIRVVPDNQAILDRIERLESTLLAASRHPLPSSARHESTSPVISIASRLINETKASKPLSNPYFFTVESVLSWPVFEVQYQSSLNLRELMTSHSLGKFDYLSRSSSGKGQPPMGVELESYPKLLDNFFSRIHIKNPILDEKEIRQWAREISLNGVGWDSHSCLVLLLCALGAVSEDFPSVDRNKRTQGYIDSADYELAETLFGASQKRIGTLLSHGGGILEAQCFFFSAVYLMHTFRPFSAWPLFLQALACCQTFLCASKISAEVFPPQDFLEDGPGWRSEESVYWTCFKSELEHRFELSLPGFNAANLTYPEFLPSPPLESLRNQEQAWYFYLAEIALRRLANQILSDFLPYSSADSICDLTTPAIRLPDFETQAEKWSNLLPPEVDIHTGDEDILRFILKGHLHNCYESMYWPFTVQAINHPEARDRSLDHLACKGLQVCVDRIWVNQPGFKHRHHGTWAMMRGCTRSALVLLAAKKCGKLDAMLRNGWEEAVEQVISLLDFWRGDCGDAEDRKNILENLLRSIRNGDYACH